MTRSKPTNCVHLISDKHTVGKSLMVMSKLVSFLRRKKLNYQSYIKNQFKMEQICQLKIPNVELAGRKYRETTLGYRT